MTIAQLEFDGSSAAHTVPLPEGWTCIVYVRGGKVRVAPRACPLLLLETCVGVSCLTTNYSLLIIGDVCWGLMNDYQLLIAVGRHWRDDREHV
jgi:hypothetical protein